MKKMLTLALAVISFTNSGSAFADAPVGLNSALSFSVETTVATSSSEIRDPQVFPLAKGNSLVSWVEEKNSTFYLRAKAVSASNKVGKIISINSSPAFSPSIEHALPRISVNAKGQFFAVWIVQATKNRVTTQQIIGRTSVDGTNWSKEFTIVKPIKITGGLDCVEEPERFTGCGFTSLNAALDNSGRYAVLFTSKPTKNNSAGATFYSVAATDMTAVWPTPKNIGYSDQLRDHEITGLVSGFAVNYTIYGFGISMAYLDPKTNKWTSLNALSSTYNTNYHSHWVQRDASKLSLVMSAEIGVGAEYQANGIVVRNFNLKTKKWAGPGVTAQQNLIHDPPGAPTVAVVFQNVTATKAGNTLLIAYTIYDSTDQSFEVKVISQNGISGSFTQASIASSGAQIDPLYVGVNQEKDPLFAYTSGGTFLGVLREGELPAPIINSASNQNLLDLTITSSNKVYGVGVNYGAKNKLILVVGQLRMLR